MNWNRHFLIIWLGWCQRRAKTATPEEKRHNCRWCVFPHSCVCVCVCLCVFVCRGNSCDVLNKLCFVANLRPSSERAHRHIYWWRRKLKTIEVGPTTKNEWKKTHTRTKMCCKRHQSSWPRRRSAIGGALALANCNRKLHLDVGRCNRILRAKLVF